MGQTSQRWSIDYKHKIQERSKQKCGDIKLILHGYGGEMMCTSFQLILYIVQIAVMLFVGYVVYLAKQHLNNQLKEKK